MQLYAAEQFAIGILCFSALCTLSLMSRRVRSALVAARTYILALVVIAALVGLAVTFLDVKTSFLAGKAWCLSQIDRLEGVLKEAGYWGPIIVFAVYFVSTIFMLPLWGFHMTCGYVYGAFYSTFLIATTQAICAGAAFLCSRHIVRPYIRGFFTRRYGRKYTAIDKAVSADGLRITLLLRLSPIIPFGINNYMCGCTEMEVWKWVVGTWLGVLPGTAAYCNLAAMGKTVRSEGTTPLQKVAMGLGIVAALAVVHILSNIAKKALSDAGINDDDEAGTDAAATDAVPASKKRDSPSSPSSASSSKTLVDDSPFIGSTVTIIGRFRPGENKPGGVARVTAVHEEGGESFVDVKYMLGGREKMIPVEYVTHDTTMDLPPRTPGRTPRRSPARG